MNRDFICEMLYYWRTKIRRKRIEELRYYTLSLKRFQHRERVNFHSLSSIFYFQIEQVKILALLEARGLEARR